MPWGPNTKNPAYGRASWRKARLACLQRARWRCEIRGPGCIGAAKIADHIYGIASDPDHKHLQAACQVCSDAKTHAESAAAKKALGPRDPEPQPRTQW